jgi:uncharacterized protein YlzI (FlbEa/FlbD family)
MRILHHILIFIFLGVALFVLKDDVKVVYNKVLTYLDDNNITAQSISDNIFSKIALTQYSVNSTDNGASTPGALKLPDDFILGIDKIKLTAKGVIGFTNTNRKDNGNLTSLKENTKLNASAMKKVQDMFAKQYFEHVSPSGVGVSDLGTQVGYEYLIIGENLALGNFKDDQALVQAWMDSPGHRANILNSKYTEIGVAVAKGMYEGRQTWIGVQHFGVPRSVCPELDEILHISIDTDQTKIKSTESDLKVRKERIDSGAVYEGYTTNEQIDQYNELVNKFNNLIEEIKQKIIEYNKQVRMLNTCIESNT